MMPSGPPTAARIVDALQQVQQKRRRPDEGTAEIMDPILALHHNNAEQWDRENDARNHDANDALVAAAKRDIDRLNIVRHGFIEAIDQAIGSAIRPCKGAPLVTESPGMAIDRLSVLVIRLASTEARAASGSADAGLYAERLPRLRSQLDALQAATATLLGDLAQGKRRFVAYESLKLYGPDHPGAAG